MYTVLYECIWMCVHVCICISSLSYECICMCVYVCICCGSLIYKLENGKNYYCKFYVGNGFKNIRSKRFEKCLNTANIKEATKIATSHFRTWFQTNPETNRAIESLVKIFLLLTSIIVSP